MFSFAIYDRVNETLFCRKRSFWSKTLFIIIIVTVRCILLLRLKHYLLLFLIEFQIKKYGLIILYMEVMECQMKLFGKNISQLSGGDYLKYENTEISIEKMVSF